MRAKRTKTEQGGFIVVVVLCMVMMLSVLLFGFHYEARASLRSVDHFRKSEQALHCARAGLQIAIASFQDSPNSQTNELWLSLLSGENTFTLGEGRCSVMISEETGKLNLNLLKDKGGKLNRVAINQVLRLFDVLNRQGDTQPRVEYDHYQVISRGSVGRLSRTVIAILQRNTATQNVDLILYKEL